ncbi:MAG: hypothetical protein IKY10_02150 [Clostridia bacterium]|nr:hypothetical protein [Clostridia bacterium]
MINSKDVYKPSAAVSISDLSSLQNFTNKVNNGEDDLAAVLTDDIDCGGATLNCIGRHVDYYSGTFDGNGFKIHNFKTDFTPSCDSGIIQYAQVFFGYTNGATIKNLRLTNFTHTMSNALSGNVSMGGLVGYPKNTKITNCQVDNFDIVSSSPNQAYIGGIAGWSEEVKTIEHCMVTNFDHSGYFSNLSKSTVFRIASISAYSYSIDQCIFIPGNSHWTLEYMGPLDNGYSNKDLYVSGSNKTLNEYVSAGQIACTSNNVYNSYSSTGGHYFRGISYKSSNGGKVSYNGYGDYEPWYYNTNYNAFPLLRSFIIWKTILVNVSDSKVATLSGSEPAFEIPEDKSIQINSTTSQNTYIEGKYFSVTITNSAYEFECWEIKGNSVVAKIKGLTGTITFMSAVNSNQSQNTQYTVSDNCTITYRMDSQKSQVTFSFIDSDGNSKRHIYKASNAKYYCSAAGMSGSLTIKTGEAKEIRPIFSLKVYDVFFE